MFRKRRRLTATCKLRIVLEALESGKAISQLFAEHEFHTNLIRD